MGDPKRMTKLPCRREEETGPDDNKNSFRVKSKAKATPLSELISECDVKESESDLDSQLCLSERGAMTTTAMRIPRRIPSPRIIPSLGGGGGGAIKAGLVHFCHLIIYFWEISLFNSAVVFF